MTDAAMLNLLGTLAVVLAVARIVGARGSVNLAPFAGDTLAGIALAAAVLLATGIDVALEPLYVGAAAMAGLQWAALVERRPRLGGVGLALSAAGAAGTVGALVFLAIAQPGWLAPTALMLLVAGGVLVAVLPRPPERADRSPTPAEVPPPPALPPQPAPAKAMVACPSCGLSGQVS
ncbi:MAG: hypothetical protein QOI63_579, partial [Thermoplasmata archaeon]|nr:hypothetical protein [Thermoplasmata archaeon]